MSLSRPDSIRSSHPLRIAIDLTPLLPGGGNGGIKPFIFEYVGWLGRQTKQPMQFVFLTRASSHAEVRSLARFSDELICILHDDTGAVIRSQTHSPQEQLWPNPPDDFVAKLKVDLLYTPFGYCRWHWPGVPTIATAADILHRDYPQTLPHHEIGTRENLFKEMTARADVIQCISQFTLERVAACYDFPRERMFCTHIAIHERLQPPSISTSPQTGTGNRYFLFPANAWKHKNHAVLLLAYGIYRHRSAAKPWDLVLTGHDDASMREVLALATSLGISEHVRYLGHLKQEEYGVIWSQAGALIFPSLYEGFGIPLIEAMGFGLPIIASHSGAIPEVGGEACMYVDARKPENLASAMSELSADEALRNDLKARGYQRLRDFSFDADANAFLERLVRCAEAPARVSMRGLYPDGWTAPHVAFNAPAWAKNARLRAVVRPMPESRTVLLNYMGNRVLTSVIPPAQPTEFTYQVPSGGRMITLDIPDARCLSATDHRTHGLWLESLVLHGQDGQLLNLMEFAQ